MRDWCEFFRAIEADPTAITPQITVREYLQAREHLGSCDVCYNSSERVLSKYSQKDKPIGFNTN